MKSKHKKLVALTFLLIGLFLLIDARIEITGSVIGVSEFSSKSAFFLALVSLAIAFILFNSVNNLEEIVEKHHWIRYPINEKGLEEDIMLKYLGDKKVDLKRTPIQERIENMVAGKTIEENINQKENYERQFFEGHASKGGRVIEVSSHLKNGKLFHFNKPANGEYIWVVDDKGNFVIGNRSEMLHEMKQMPNNKYHDKRTRLPHPTLARGREVYGAGEVTIRDGLIVDYNADSGHYIKIFSDEGGLPEPDNFNEQSFEVFSYFSKKYGWKEISSGAKRNSKHYKKKVTLSFA